MTQQNEIRELNRQLETVKKKYVSISTQNKQNGMTISRQKILNEKLRQALVQLNNELEKEKEESRAFSNKVEELQKKSQQTVESVEVKSLKQLIEDQLYYLEENKRNHKYEQHQFEQKYTELKIEMQNQKELSEQYQEKIQSYDNYIREIKQHTNEEYAKIQGEFDEKSRTFAIEKEKLQEQISILGKYQLQYIDIQQEYELLQQKLTYLMEQLSDMEKENMDLKDQLSNATIGLEGLTSNVNKTAALEEQIAEYKLQFEEMQKELSHHTKVDERLLQKENEIEDVRKQLKEHFELQMAQQQVGFEHQLEELKSVQTVGSPATNLDMPEEMESLKKQVVEQRVNARQYLDEIAFLNKKLAVLEEKLKLKLTKDTDRKIELITLDYEKMFAEELLEK